MPYSTPPDTPRSGDRVIIVLLVALLLLISPLTRWWAAEDASWLAPYLIWGVIIALIARLQRGRHEL